MGRAGTTYGRGDRRACPSLPERRTAPTRAVRPPNWSGWETSFEVHVRRSRAATTRDPYAQQGPGGPQPSDDGSSPNAADSAEIAPSSPATYAVLAVSSPRRMDSSTRSSPSRASRSVAGSSLGERLECGIASIMPRWRSQCARTDFGPLRAGGGSQAGRAAATGVPPRRKFGTRRAMPVASGSPVPPRPSVRRR